MSSQIKQIGYLLVSSLVLGLSLHTAAAVYSCHSAGKKIYTSEPHADCANAELPKISSHQGGAYRLKIAKLASETEEKSVKPKKARSKGKVRENTDGGEAKKQSGKKRSKKSDKDKQTSSEQE